MLAVLFLGKNMKIMLVMTNKSMTNYVKNYSSSTLVGASGLP